LEGFPGTSEDLPGTLEDLSGTIEIEKRNEGKKWG